MRTGANLKNRQGGAVAVMVGISIVVLVGFLALVLDLGHVYIAKTELQNAADAAALSGAKQLNGTYWGCCDTTNPNSGVNKAIAIAAQNNYDFSNPVNITISNISVGSSPTSMVPASSVSTDAAAADKTFLMVDTGPRQLGTWFAPIFNLVTGESHSLTSTFGMAVAGRYITNITPLGVCAIEEIKTRRNSATDELIEFGFRRGVSYNIPELNPLVGLSQDPYWINPVDIPPACSPSNSSTNVINPFVCVGRSAIITALPTEVWINPGTSAALEKALNSRFDDYTGSPCNPATAPPDANVREYRCTDTANPENCDKDRMPTQDYASINLPRDWMAPSDTTTPTRQAIGIDAVTKVPVASPDFSTQYGILWAYNRAVHVDGSTPPKAGAPFNADDTDWGSLYGGTIDTTVSGYPDPSNPTAVPYNQASGKYFLPPPYNPPGIANRRLLSIAIVDCRAGPIGGGGPCGTRMRVIGVGKFFMTRGAKVSGGGNARIPGEFAGIVDPLPPADIRLYR